MAALTEDKQRLHKGHGFRDTVQVKASTTIYKGAITATDATGYLVNASDTAGLKVFGIAEEQANNSAGASGDIDCQNFVGYLHLLSSSGADQTWLNQPVYAVDNDTVALAATTTNDILVGIVRYVKSATEVWVYVGVQGL